MKAVVSTPLYLLLVDIETHQVELIESDRPEYYGISWVPGSSELVLGHSGVDNATLRVLADYAMSRWGTDDTRPAVPLLSVRPAPDPL